MKKLELVRNCLIFFVSILCIILLLTFLNVHKMQGTARVINYAGITRGATQRLVKLEITNQPNPELEEKLDVILQELKNGGKINKLHRYDDKDYNACLDLQRDLWALLKDKIEVTRECGYEASNILELSEQYYTLADNTVSAAEKYADKIAGRIAILEIISAVIIVILFVLFVIATIVSKKMHAEQLKSIKLLAEHDGMTELLNRRSFDENLHLYETSGEPYALIILDVDLFKQYNDNYGHTMGDNVLKRVANNLKVNFRSGDKLFRIGGDEFAVIMTEITPALKFIVENKVKNLIEALTEEKDGIPAVTLSIGIAFSQDIVKGKHIFEAADESLYFVKEHGRNNYEFYKKNNQ